MRNLGVSRSELASRRCRLRNRHVWSIGSWSSADWRWDRRYNPCNKGHPMKSHNIRVPAILSAVAALLLASVGGGFAPSPLKMDFVRHAAFFSTEFKQQKALDPQVFI